MTADPKLALQARWLRCRALAWEITAEAACQAATWAFSRQREATACAEIVESRSLHPSRSQP